MTGQERLTRGGESIETVAATLIAKLRPHHEALVEAAISGIANLHCDTAAGDSYDPDEYREDATAAVAAVRELRDRVANRMMATARVSELDAALAAAEIPSAATGEDTDQ